MISQPSNLSVGLFEVSEKEKREDITAIILRTMDEIESFAPEVILLFTNKENTEMILQQVNGQFSFYLHLEVGFQGRQ